MSRMIALTMGARRRAAADGGEVRCRGVDRLRAYAHKRLASALTHKPENIARSEPYRF